MINVRCAGCLEPAGVCFWTKGCGPGSRLLLHAIVQVCIHIAPHWFIMQRAESMVGNELVS